MTSALVRRHIGKTPNGNGDRDWSDVSRSRRTPSIARNHQKLSRDRKDALRDGLTLPCRFQTPSPRNERIFLLVKAASFVVLRYSSPEKLVHHVETVLRSSGRPTPNTSQRSPEPTC